MRKIKPQLVFQNISCKFAPGDENFHQIWVARPLNPTATIDRLTGKPINMRTFVCRIVDNGNHLDVTKQTRNIHGRRYDCYRSEDFPEAQRNLIRWFERNFELDPKFTSVLRPGIA